MPWLWASIGVTRSYSSRPFLCALDDTYRCFGSSSNSFLPFLRTTLHKERSPLMIRTHVHHSLVHFLFPAYINTQYMTGSVKRGHFTLFHRIFQFLAICTIPYLNNHNKNGMMFGTVRVPLANVILS